MKRAQFLLAQNDAGQFAARQLRNSGCPRVYLPGGALAEKETLESACEKQGWKIKRGKLIHYDEIRGFKVEWFAGEARQIPGTQARPRWAEQGTLERFDAMHADAFDIYAETKGARL